MEGIWSDLTAARRWRAAAHISIICAMPLAAFFLARRAAGDVSSPIATALLFPTAAGLVAWAWLVRLAFQCYPAVKALRFPVSLLWQEIILSVWLPTFTVFAFAVALSFPGARFVDWFAWLPALAAIILGPARVLQVRGNAGVRPRGEANEMTVQNLQRYRSDDGRESVRGTLATEFVAEQRTATLYAAFCPPFENLPQVKGHAQNRGASVKVAQVLHNGVQFEVRLAREATQNQVVTVDFVASETDAAS